VNLKETMTAHHIGESSSHERAANQQSSTEQATLRSVTHERWSRTWVLVQRRSDGDGSTLRRGLWCSPTLPRD
jgi:hypothetical protein